jgi:hypothetical protein
LDTSPRFSAYRGASINITAIVMTIPCGKKQQHLSVSFERRRGSSPSISEMKRD